MSLLAKYRPQTLDEVLGQPGIVRALKRFTKAPYATAMLFHGETGIGKGAAAYALARDLGIMPDEGELGGWHVIASGEMTGEMVRKSLCRLQLGTLFGSHWKVLLCNEADRMTTGAEDVWLDGLENLPERAIVIFTSNEPQAISKRLRDRCDSYGFESDPTTLQPDIQRLARRVWKAEGCRGKVPMLDTLGMPTLGDLDTMHASFRLAMHQLTRLIREAKARDRNMGDAVRQLQRDQLVEDASTELTITCEGCKQEVKVRPGAKSIKCPHCGHVNTVEWS